MKRDISRQILKYLLLVGIISIASTSPYFFPRLFKVIWKSFEYNPPQRKKYLDAFNYLKRKGFINVERDGYDVVVILTEKGKKKAGKYQIDDLKIEKPKKWDRHWRIVVFDIPNSQRIKRDVFRRKLKELGFYSIQKSVWLHAFSCEKEVELLKSFLGLDNKQIQVILADSLENKYLNKQLKKIYKI